MKLQKQLSRKVGNTKYAKWVVIIPPEVIKETGWAEGEELEALLKNNRVVLKSKRTSS